MQLSPELSDSPGIRRLGRAQVALAKLHLLFNNALHVIVHSSLLEELGAENVTAASDAATSGAKTRGAPPRGASTAAKLPRSDGHDEAAHAAGASITAKSALHARGLGKPPGGGWTGPAS